ncbi:hypothetical protein KBA27_02995, partial [bacterium]|nr:hypothetical protein [bacterium]
TALVSALTKDAVNCYYYTTQSWNNKEMSPEQRSYVGSMDLMNGVLNIAGQFVIGRWIENHTSGWAKSLFGKKLNEENTVEIAHKLSDKLKENKGGLDIAPEKIQKYLTNKKVVGLKGSKFTWLSIGFSALTTLLGTQILCKRVITPFLATPLAGYFSKFRDKKQSEKANIAQQQPVDAKA